VTLQELTVEAVGTGLVVKKPVVLVRSLAQAYARVRALRRGEHRIRIKAGEHVVEKTVRVDSPGPVSLQRERESSLAALLSHEPPLPGPSPFRAIAIDYPHSLQRWLAMPWYVLLLLISLVAAFALRRRLGVVF
jgi:hypothetical protein